LRAASSTRKAGEGHRGQGGEFICASRAAVCRMVSRGRADAQSSRSQKFFEADGRVVDAAGQDWDETWVIQPGVRLFASAFSASRGRNPFSTALPTLPSADQIRYRAIGNSPSTRRKAAIQSRVITNAEASCRVPASALPERPPRKGPMAKTPGIRAIPTRGAGLYRGQPLA